MPPLEQKQMNIITLLISLYTQPGAIFLGPCLGTRATLQDRFLLPELETFVEWDPDLDCLPMLRSALLWTIDEQVLSSERDTSKSVAVQAATELCLELRSV